MKTKLVIFLFLLPILCNPIFINAEKCSIFKVDHHRFPEMSVYVDILDDQGKSIRDLNSNSFKVFEDGKEIKNFEALLIYRSGEWLDVIIGIDKSGSMRGEPLEKAKNAAIEFISHLSFSDRVSLLIYDDKIDFLTDFIRNKKLLREKITAIETSKDTALFDSLLMSLEKSEKSTSPRKAIIIFTDGQDTSSQTRIEDLIVRIKKSEIPCFMIGFGGDVNQKLLIKISSSSGQQYMPNPELEDIAGIYDSLAKDLAPQYLIKYQSHADLSKGMHTVEIQCRTPRTTVKDRRRFSLFNFSSVTKLILSRK